MAETVTTGQPRPSTCSARLRNALGCSCRLRRDARCGRSLIAPALLYAYATTARHTHTLRAAPRTFKVKSA
jgi:hypothetical protein